jgi:hypothetical protein
MRMMRTPGTVTERVAVGGLDDSAPQPLVAASRRDQGVQSSNLCVPTIFISTPSSGGVFRGSRHRGPRFARTFERSATGLRKQASVTLAPHALAGYTGRVGLAHQSCVNANGPPSRGGGSRHPSAITALGAFETRGGKPPTGCARYGFLHREDLPARWSLRRKPCLATLGDRVHDRVSRPRRRPPRSFPGGAVLLPAREMLPHRETTERGRSAVV